MKSGYSLLRWPCLLQDALNRRLLVQNKPAAVAPKEKPSPIISSFLELGQKKTVDVIKICGGAEMLLKTETQQTFVNGLLGFITFRHFIAGSVYCFINNCMSCPSIWATLFALSRNGYRVPSSCFCIWSASLWGWNNPTSGCLPVGGGCIIHAGGGGGFTHWLTDCFDVQPTTRAATSSRRASLAEKIS